MQSSTARTFGSLPTAPYDPAVAPHAPGTVVVQRSVRDFPESGPAVGFAVGGIVLRDDDELMVMMTVPGSEMAGRAGPGSGPNGRLVAPGDWDGSYETSAWRGSTVVRVHRPGQSWSIWRWHDGEDWTRAWYGNLESPWRRTPLGYDMQDWALDVVAEGIPGTDDWTVAMKDEDELEWFVARGTATRGIADRITAVGRELRAVFEDGEALLAIDWEALVPPADAHLVALPEGWQELRPPVGASR